MPPRVASPLKPFPIDPAKLYELPIDRKAIVVAAYQLAGTANSLRRLVERDLGGPSSGSRLLGDLERLDREAATYYEQLQREITYRRAVAGLVALRSTWGMASEELARANLADRRVSRDRDQIESLVETLRTLLKIPMSEREYLDNLAEQLVEDSSWFVRHLRGQAPLPARILPTIKQAEDVVEVARELKRGIAAGDSPAAIDNDMTVLEQTWGRFVSSLNTAEAPRDSALVERRDRTVSLITHLRQRLQATR
ncbi:hypothetical protein Pan216_55850 [Planctomycetes bacterium Pan216]|uniref:Uncharacterized protein n=2 Tax=Kolteria novifilia TaxID=2527975 RepID=A0A518BCJ0_9BACT|nr:hypothetical protein Pan216_55850 [Planctomycetes bacterium Pan216]